MSNGNYDNSTINKNRSNFTNLYVKNFGKDINETKLCQLFSEYGIITSCKIQTDGNGESRGFGFVNFERSDMAQHAMEKLNGYLLGDNKRLYVAPFQRKSERQKILQRIQEENYETRSNKLCLYVSNLDIMIDEKLLEQVFSRFGRVINTHILRNGSQSKGIGFVCFNTIEETTRALNAMNGEWILTKPIYVKLSKDMNTSQLSIPSSPMPSNPPAMIPMPYLNSPTIFYVPTVMVPPSPVNHFSLPTALPNPRGHSTSIRSSLPSPAMISPPTTTHVKHQFYPYTPVKNDDEQNDS